MLGTQLVTPSFSPPWRRNPSPFIRAMNALRASMSPYRWGGWTASKPPRATGSVS